ncbi:MAG: HAD-IC family P-type ATPase, partial [Acidimicrobiia bacterium]
DKTGTLTTGLIRHRETVVLSERDPADLAGAVAAIAAADPHPNPTMQGVAEAFPDDPGWSVERFVPFSSERKFSAVRFADGCSWVIGAPEIVLEGREPDLAKRLDEVAATGQRVLLVAATEAPLQNDDGTLPDRLEPVGYLTFAEEIRSDASDTISYFVEQNVSPKVISGDAALTVGAIAGAVGVPNADRALDARDLPDSDTPEFAHVVNDASVFGRVIPDQKRHMVNAMQEAGHTVAMTGDGVNDVLALKGADIGIAMGSGSPATRAVAQIVLLDNRFASLPYVVAEGRRVIANMERVASLFVTKTVYAAILAVAIGFVGWAFPLLPRHLTLIGSLTIGIPAFFLSFEATDEPVRTGAFSRIMRFAVPAGIVAATAAYGVYSAARAIEGDLTIARSATTITMVLVGMWILIELVTPLTPSRLALVGAMMASFALTLIVPLGRTFFDLVIPPLDIIGVIAAATIVAAIVLHVALRVVDHHEGPWLPGLPADKENG